MDRRRGTGTSLIEALLIVAIFAIVCAAGVPPLQQLVARQRLLAAVEAVAADLRLARAEAIRRNSVVTLAFRDAAPWCYALSDGGDCDCARPGGCAIGGRPARIVAQRDFPAVALRAGFARAAAYFYPARGTATSGTVALTAPGGSARVVVSTLGRIRVCSDELPDYPPC